MTCTVKTVYIGYKITMSPLRAHVTKGLCANLCHVIAAVVDRYFQGNLPISYGCILKAVTLNQQSKQQQQQ